MLISNALGSFSLNEADNLRKAMGKKKPEIMEKFAAKFVEGAMASGCAQGVARETWDNIVKFGGYGFNKSHSTAYAVLTYQTAYLKANHRAAFLAANLSCEMGDSDKVKAFVDDARRAGIAMLAPHVEKSAWEFALDGNAIRFGFGAIKGTGSKAIDGLIAARARLALRNEPLSLHALCSERDPAEGGKGNFEAMIKAGAFDCTGHNRGAVLAALDAAMSDGTRASLDRKNGQMGLFDSGGASSGGTQGTRGMPAARSANDASSNDSPAAHSSDGIDDTKGWDKADTLRAEYETLGFYLSDHPLEERAGLLGLLSTVRMDELGELPGGSEVTLAGLVLKLSENVVKSGKLAGKKMARFRLEDLRGSVGVTVFPRTFEECRHKLEEESEEPALLLQELMTVEEAIARFAGGIVVALDATDGHLLPRLQETIARHKGARPLFLSITGEDGKSRRVRTGKDWNVAISEQFAREVDSVLGRGRVRLARV